MIKEEDSGLAERAPRTALRHLVAERTRPPTEAVSTARYRRRHRRKTGAPAPQMAMTMVALAAAPTSTRMTVSV
jgi:hypothetical protein